jgi:hypothetical protein
MVFARAKQYRFNLKFIAAAIYRCAPLYQAFIIS